MLHVDDLITPRPKEIAGISACVFDGRIPTAPLCRRKQTMFAGKAEAQIASFWGPIRSKLRNR
jgi:hypothetical protein